MVRIHGIACCLSALMAASLSAESPTTSINRMLSSLGPEEYRAAAGMVTMATCTGPGGDFTTEVISVRPDVTLFTQRSGRGDRRLLVAGKRVWSLGGDSQTPEPADPAVRAFVRGHEFHLTLLDVEERFSDFADGGPDRAGGAPCTRLAMKDGRGLSFRLCLDPATHRPLRLTFMPAQDADPIVIAYRDWIEDAGLALFRGFELRQGDETFTYRYDVVAPVAVPPGFFDPGADPAWLAARLDDLAAVAISHHRLMEAHRRSDPAMCFGDDAKDYVWVNRGDMSRPAPADRRTRFFSYLERTDYEVYRDLAPPEVSIARDGSLAWLACEMEAEGVQRQDDGSTPPIRFNAAWVELMRSENGRWMRVGDASSSRE